MIVSRGIWSEPRSGLGQVFNFKLGCSVSEKCNCRTCTWPLLELKTQPRLSEVYFHKDVCISLYICCYINHYTYWI